MHPSRYAQRKQSTENLRRIWLDSEKSSCCRCSTVTTPFFVSCQSQSKFHRMCNDTAETVLWLFLFFSNLWGHCALCYTCSMFILKDSPSWNVVFFFLPTAPFSVTKCIFSMATRPVGSAAFQDIRRFRTCSCQTEVTTSCVLGSNDQERLVWKLSLFHFCLVTAKSVFKSNSFCVGFMFCFWYKKNKNNDQI